MSEQEREMLIRAAGHIVAAIEALDDSELCCYGKRLSRPAKCKRKLDEILNTLNTEIDK